MDLTAQEHSALASSLSEVPEDLRSRFDAAFKAWKRTWFSGSLAIDSNPHARARGDAFDDLVAMGPAILPLVVETLTDDDNFLSLVLYDAIQRDARFTVK